jgi:predicted transcriptional regulator
LISLQEFTVQRLSQLSPPSRIVFNSDDEVSTVLGELKRTGQYEGIVTVGNKVGLVAIRDFLVVTQPVHTKVTNLFTVTGALSPEDRVIDLTEKLIRDNIRAVPLVKNGIVVGGISQTDLLEALSDISEYSKIRAKDVMTTPVLSLESNDGIEKVRKLMLDNDISHVPITDNQELVGIICAKDIVHTFIAPRGTMTVGEHVGEKIARFEGEAKAIMDAYPVTAQEDTPTLTIIRDLMNQGKSACIVVDETNRIQGIITPREVLTPLLQFKETTKLPIYIVGLTDEEDFFEKAMAEEKVRRTVQRGMKMHPHITEVSVRIKRQQQRGNRVRYQMTARALSAVDQFIVTTEGWNLLETFDELCQRLGNSLTKTKHLPKRTTRRWLRPDRK